MTTADIQNSFESLSLLNRKDALLTCNPLEREFLIRSICPSLNASPKQLSDMNLKRRVMSIIKDPGLKSPILYSYTTPLKKIYRLWSRFLESCYIFFRGGISFQLALRNIASASTSIKQPIKTDLVKLKISQTQLLDLLKDMKDSKQINLESELRTHNYSLEIEDIEFENTRFLFSDINIDNVCFKNCTFSNVIFSASKIQKTTFDNCEFSQISFMQTNLNDVKFNSCIFRQTSFWKANLTDTLFESSELLSTSFEESDIISVKFCNSQLPGTFFLQSKITKLMIRNSLLIDTVFFNASLAEIDIDEISQRTFNPLTKPLVLTLSHSEKQLIATPKVLREIEKRGAIPIPIHFEPFNLQSPCNDTISELLSMLFKTESETPIPQQLLAEIKKTENPELQLILEKIEILKAHIQGVILPGGENVPQSLFALPLEGDSLSDNYARSILEIAIIEMTETYDIPILTLCRGFQMMAVYHGGRISTLPYLHQGVDYVTPVSELDTQVQILSVFKKSFQGVFAHYQVVNEEDLPQTDLMPLAKTNRIITAFQSRREGVAFNLNLQFHPEFLCDDTAFSCVEYILDLWCKSCMSQSENNMILGAFLQSVFDEFNEQKSYRTLIITK